MNSEKRTLFIRYARKIRMELDVRRYVRFKMIAYYFPEVITEDRLLKLYHYLENDMDFFMFLSESEKYSAFEQCMYSDNVLMSDKFFKFFNI